MNESTHSSRRTFLKVAAGGALGASTGRIVATSVAQESYTGKLVFTYDDGVVEDFTQTYEDAHKPEGVPACTAVVSGHVGYSTSLSESQVRELHDAGWEIMSHTVTHRALSDITVTRDIAAEDERIYVNVNYHGKIPGDTLLVTDGTNSEVVTVAGQGTDDRGEYIEIEEPISQSFAAAETVERYTDDIIRYVLRQSQSTLEGYGATVTNMVMPYSAYGDRTQDLVSEYYTAVANAENNNPEEVNGEEGLNPVDNFNLPHLSRRYFRDGKMTYDEIAAFLDRVSEEEVLGIFGGHSWWNRHGEDKLPPARIRDTIQMAKDRNIEIVTLQQALSDLGYTDGPSETTQTTETTTDPTTTATTTDTPTTSTTTTSNPKTTTTQTTTATKTTTSDPGTTTTTTTDPTTTTTTTDPTTTTTTADPTTTATTTTTETTTTTSTTTQTTTTQNDGGGNSRNRNSNDNDGGWSSSSNDDSRSTTTSAPTTTTTESPTTTLESTTTARTTTELPTAPETVNLTETATPVRTQTPIENGTSTSVQTRTSIEAETNFTTKYSTPTSETGTPAIDAPGFGWLSAFGAAGSVAAYALSRLNDTDEKQ